MRLLCVSVQYLSFSPEAMLLAINISRADLQDMVKKMAPLQEDMGDILRDLANITSDMELPPVADNLHGTVSGETTCHTRSVGPLLG